MCCAGICISNATAYVEECTASAVCLWHDVQLVTLLRSKRCIAIYLGTTHPLGDLVFCRLELGYRITDLAHPGSHDERMSPEKEAPRTTAPKGGKKPALTSHSIPNSFARLAL